MLNILKPDRLLARVGRFAIPCAFVCAMATTASPQSSTITITLVGQSMIRSDIRETLPAALPVIKGLLKGDVIFTNVEAAVAEKGEIADIDLKAKNNVNIFTPLYSD